MSEQTIRVSRSIDVPAAMPWLVALAVYLLLMVLGNRLLGDADTYWHITLGRLILEQRALPTGEALSQTVHATHWVAYEWLAQIAYAAAYALGGWVAVAALTAAAAAAAFGLLARYLLKYWRPTPTLAAVLAALVLTSPHIMARPHVLALPLMVTWIAALIRAVDTARPPSWWLLPLLTLWANLHGSFIFGLAMTGVIAGEAIWLAPAPQRRRVATDWIAFAALALGAVCLNPYGPELILATIRILSLGQALALIVEWRPQDFSKLGAYEMVVLAGMGLALWRGVRLPPFRILMLLGVLHFSLAQSRHADLLGMLAPLLLARPLAMQFATLAANSGEAELHRPLHWSWLPAAAALLLAAAGRHRRQRRPRQHRARCRHHAGERGQGAHRRHARTDPQRLRPGRLSRFCRHRALHRRPHRALRRSLRGALPPRRQPGKSARFPAAPRREPHRGDAVAAGDAGGGATRPATGLAPRLCRRHRRRPRPPLAALSSDRAVRRGWPGQARP